MTDILRGKRILIVDDEPDVLETLTELLDTCIIDFAPDFETAKGLLKKKSYDAAILDIMGVKGYDLLEISREREIPALMLTAHALSADHLVKSIRQGAYAYIPKHEMADMASYVVEVIQAGAKGGRKPIGWFKKLTPFFNQKFGPTWMDTHKDAVRSLDLRHSREELEDIL